MPVSMTGFGSARRTGPLGSFSIEIRAVNNRHLDLTFRGASDFRDWEAAARETLRRRVARGKVDVTVAWEPAPQVRPTLRVNRPLLDGLIHDLEQVAKESGASAWQLLGPLAAIPNALQLAPPEIDARALAAELDAALSEALDRFQEARAREGAALAEDLLARAAALRRHVARIEETKDAAVERYRARLAELAASLSREARAALDPGRLEAEIALYADRCDISEELVRLRAHLDDLESKLRTGGDESLGKPLEFLVQELLRETNTIGSKARDTAAIQTVLEMKNEIEKIREQAQNIE